MIYWISAIYTVVMNVVNERFLKLWFVYFGHLGAAEQTLLAIKPTKFTTTTTNYFSLCPINLQNLYFLLNTTTVAANNDANMLYNEG